jgi:hypothetical protein
VAPERCLKISTAILSACRCLSNDDILQFDPCDRGDQSTVDDCSTSDVKPPELELAQEVGSQVASSANLLAVDTEVVERLLDPAENELQNVVKLFQRKVVRYRNQAWRRAG